MCLIVPGVGPVRYGAMATNHFIAVRGRPRCMAYVRVKTIKGRPYRYLVEGVREDGRVRQRVIKYLGPVKPVRRAG